MDFKNFAMQMAMDAGRIIRNNFVRGMKKEWKDDLSPVTQTDVAINRMLIERVRKDFPDHGVIGEEESHRNEGAAYQWVCDPIDGTIPFSHGIPTCVFSLALVKDGVPVIGVIYDPFMDRLFSAEKGGGAMLNGERITVSGAATFAKTVVGLELARGGKTQIALNGLRDFFKKEYSTKCLSLGCVMYEGMLVACGELSAVVFTGRTCHDGASLKVIVEEAGGRVTDVLGNEQRYDREINGFIASNGILHDAIIAAIRDVRL